jgi:hypothetical protein
MPGLFAAQLDLGQEETACNAVTLKRFAASCDFAF